VTRVHETRRNTRRNTRLWVARHAPVIAENRCYGRTDVTPQIAHDRAAKGLIDSFPEKTPDIVWTSPLSRCRALAEHLAAHFRASLRVDASLHEMDFGAWDGLTWPEIEARDPDAYARWLREWEHIAPPGGEGPRDLEARVRAWFSSLDPARDHALVAHAGVVRALHVVIHARSWPEAMQLPVEHLSWMRFESGALDMTTARRQHARR